MATEDSYLTTNPQKYGNYLKPYERYANEYNSSWLLNNAYEILNSLLSEVKHEFASLAIGCSYGIRDIKILNKICSEVTENVSVVYRAIEPDTSGLQEFVADIKSHFGDRVKLDALNLTWQKYIKEYKSEQKFDFITSFQSIYFMDAESTLVDCYKQLKPGGVVMCVASGDTPDGQKQNYWANPVGFYDGELSLPEGSFTVCTSSMLVDIAKKHNWSYKVTNYPAFIDATVFFEEESAESDALLDILLHIKGSKSQLTPEKRKILVDKIKKNCVDVDGKKYIENTHCVFFINKV